MICEFGVGNLPSLLRRQLEGFFPLDAEERELLERGIALALQRVEHCFSLVENKYFRRGDESFFNPFHSGQWLIFLYYTANTLSCRMEGDAVPVAKRKLLADKVYYLNKIMNGVDIYHEVELPSVFFMEHPVGTVMGRAVYGDGLMAYQQCTVGGNKGKYPVIGRNFRMMSGSKVLGNSHIGDNVTLAANTYVKDTDIPSGATVFGASPHLTLKFL